MKMIESKYSFSELRRSCRGTNAAFRTSARYSIRWLNAPLVRMDVEIFTRSPTDLHRASKIRRSAFVWSVEPFSYIDTYTFWYPRMADTRKSVENRSGMTSNELYRLIAKKYLWFSAGRRREGGM